MASALRDLKLWQEAVALGGDVARVVHGCSRRETRQVTDQILHTAHVAAARIAEGYERPAPEEQMPLYRAARVALTVLDTQLAIARHAGILPAPTLAQLTTRSAAVARLLGGYLTFLERQIAAAAAARPPERASDPALPSTAQGRSLVTLP